jgi:hypothetical protein
LRCRTRQTAKPGEPHGRRSAQSAAPAVASQSARSAGGVCFGRGTGASAQAHVGELDCGAYKCCGALSRFRGFDVAVWMRFFATGRRCELISCR